MGASQSGIKSGKFENGILVLNKEDGSKTEVTGFVTSDSLKNFVTPKTIKKDGVDVEDPYVVTSVMDAKFATFQATPGPPGKDGAPGKDGQSITGPPGKDGAPGKDGQSITGPPGKDAVITKEIEGTLATSLASNATFNSSVASNQTLGANVASNTTLRTAVGTSLGNNLDFRSAVAGNADLRTAVAGNLAGNATFSSSVAGNLGTNLSGVLPANIALRNTLANAVAGNADLRTGVAGNLAKDDTFRTAIGPIVAGNEDLRKSVANNALLRANVASDGGFKSGVSTILKADTGFISSLKGAKGDTGTVSDTKTAKIDTLNVPTALNVAGVASFSGDVNFSKKATFDSEIDVKNNANHRGTWTNFHGRTYFKKDVDLENSVKLALQNKDGKWSELNKQDGEWKHIFRGGKILVESDLKVDGSVNVDKICNKDGKNCVNVNDLLANKSTVTFRNIQRGNDGFLKAFQDNGLGVRGGEEGNWTSWELTKK